MGIPGLTTLMNNHYHWLKVRPKGGIVIDGHSLMYTIHENVGIDWIHGGQYWLLRKHIIEFFTCLRSSAIKPIVIMDGFDYTGQREPIKIARRQRSMDAIIRNLVHEPHGQPVQQGVVSILAQHVFTYVLDELSIPLYVVDGEADPVIVAFANHYHYPVVGNDSDYFMFNLEHGYIPINRLNWENQPVTADMYKLNDFISTFGINNAPLSLVIPSIMGCDYIEKSVKTFIEEGVLSTLPGDVVASLVRYISKMKSVEELIRHIERTLDKGETIGKSLLHNIEKAEEIYNVKGTISEEQLLHDSILLTDKYSRGNTKIPRWVLDQHRRGKFGSQLLCGIVLGRVIIKRGIIDNPNKPCAMSVCLRIQKSMFTILSPLMKSDEVVVFTRVGHELSPEVLKFDMNSKTLPTIHSIAKLSKEKRITLLCQVAGIDPQVLKPFDDQWKLVVASACYWVKNCNPGKDIIIALVRTFLYCHRLTHSDCSTEYEVLMALPDMRRTKAWLDTLHTFTSFQCTYYSMVNLNEVLKCPLLSVSPAFIFDGKFAQRYACTDELEKMLRRDFIQDAPMYDRLMSTLMDHIPGKT